MCNRNGDRDLLCTRLTLCRERSCVLGVLAKCADEAALLAAQKYLVLPLSPSARSSSRLGQDHRTNARVSKTAVTHSLHQTRNERDSIWRRGDALARPGASCIKNRLALPRRQPQFNMLALLATASHGFAGVTPKSSREPGRGFRSGVLTQLGLIPSGKKPAAQLQWLTDNLKLRTAAPYSQRREAVLRYRVAQQRSEVEKLANEINALEARNENLRARPETSARRCRTEEEANDERISTLRRDAGVAEGKILRLKLKLGEKKGASRPGLLGAAARAAETLTAAEERSAAVLFSQLRRESDPWALLREDIGSIARLGSNLTLTTGYLQLMSRGGGSRLPAHAAAIIARSAKLERYAPGILLAVDGYLDLIEPHLDNILERFDEIEPHLPWVLDNLDSLAPYCTLLSFSSHESSARAAREQRTLSASQLTPAHRPLKPWFSAHRRNARVVSRRRYTFPHLPSPSLTFPHLPSPSFTSRVSGRRYAARPLRRADALRRRGRQVLAHPPPLSAALRSQA